jgi:membrane protein required for colicin V production
MMATAISKAARQRLKLCGKSARRREKTRDAVNWLDMIIIAIVAVGAVYGLLRGILRMATMLISLLAGIYLALVYYAEVGGLIQKWFPAASSTVAAALGYAAVFALVFVIVEASGYLLMRVVETVNLGWLDRLGGMLFGAAISAAVCGLLLMLMTAAMPADAALLRDSEIAPQVLDYTETLLNYIPPQVKQAYQAKRDSLTRYWLHHLAPQAASSAQTHASPSPPP